MPAVLLLGDKNILFRTLGIPYMLLLREESDTCIIYDVEQGRQTFHELLKAREISASELLRLDAQIIEMGLLDRIEDVVERVRAFPPQKDVPPMTNAVFCSRCLPTGHIHITDTDGEGRSDPIPSFETCFDLVWRAVHRGKLHLYDGICILQTAVTEVGRHFPITMRERIPVYRAETKDIAVG